VQTDSSLAQAMEREPEIAPTVHAVANTRPQEGTRFNGIFGCTVNDSLTDPSEQWGHHKPLANRER
jgi:hypothetical protein